ncbi:MAG: hypothetical protein ACK5LC_16140 [Coprobacillaceae bacterium]
MNNKEKIKYFYETIVSRNLISEVANYISSNCVIKIGEKSIPIGVEGMKEP